jgi:hypothetical protein
MRFSIPSRLALAALFLAHGCLLAGASAQSQDSSASSVADAAKRAREQKQNATSKAKVITDDDVDAKSVKPGEEGLTVPQPPQLDTQPPSPDAVAAVEASDRKREEAPADDPLKKGDSAKVVRLKQELAQAEEDVKLSQRESALQQDTVYSKPDYQRDTQGKAKLDELQQQIADKQVRVEQLKTRLAEAEESGKRKAVSAPRPAAPADQAPESAPATPPQD